MVSGPLLLRNVQDVYGIFLERNPLFFKIVSFSTKDFNLKWILDFNLKINVLKIVAEFHTFYNLQLRASRGGWIQDFGPHRLVYVPQRARPYFHFTFECFNWHVRGRTLRKIIIPRSLCVNILGFNPQALSLIFILFISLFSGHFFFSPFL